MRTPILPLFLNCSSPFTSGVNMIYPFFHPDPMLSTSFCQVPAVCIGITGMVVLGANRTNSWLPLGNHKGFIQQLLWKPPHCYCQELLLPLAPHIHLAVFHTPRGMQTMDRKPQILTSVMWDCQENWRTGVLGATGKCCGAPAYAKKEYTLGEREGKKGLYIFFRNGNWESIIFFFVPWFPTLYPFYLWSMNFHLKLTVWVHKRTCN